MKSSTGFSFWVLWLNLTLTLATMLPAGESGCRSYIFYSFANFNFKNAQTVSVCPSGTDLSA